MRSEVRAGIYTKQEVIDALLAESPVRISVTNFSATIVAAGVALVRYQSARFGESGQMESMSFRSSLWVLRDNRWQMAFHQGTRVAGRV